MYSLHFYMILISLLICNVHAMENKINMFFISISTDARDNYNENIDLWKRAWLVHGRKKWIQWELKFADDESSLSTNEE